MRSTFKKNRIGFCVLHDASLAGQPCVIEHTDGRFITGQFPAEVAPHQPYLNVRAIEHTVDGTKVNVRMEGDTFEMEDQRNWSDASYKTYCTILALPFPVVIEAGTTIQQTVTLSVIGSAQAASRESELVIRAIDQETPLPKLGVCLADEAVPLAHPQLEALRALMLDHVRVDLEPASSAFEARLAYAQRLSLDLAVPLEVALWLNDTAVDLQRFTQALQQTPLNVARWLVFIGVRASQRRPQWSRPVRCCKA
ncbi:hypothetical protein HC776_00565 [bacterium]|nr:hypothetical protein [bacterium]